MGLWRRAIAQVVAYRPAQTSLGKLTTEGHKVWEWQIQESNGHFVDNIRIVLRFADIFGGGNTSTSEQVGPVG
jgi:hypothetical protein